ncbi:FecR family protein [Sphingobacterium corticis]|uniref:FecR family protein n=1 Tax=Sphingobacterium corticis TaxID=1812823 RepID=A0ABW5NK42_9SPHI
MDSNESRLRYLMDRCLSKQETLAERNELYSYFLETKEDDNLSEELLNAFYKEKEIVDVAPEKQEQILSAIKSLESPRPSVTPMYWKWTSIAAVFIAVLVSIFWKVTQEEVTSKIKFVAKKEIVNDSLTEPYPKVISDHTPAKDVAILELADGQKFELEKLKLRESIENKGVIIERSGEDTLRVYAASNNSRFTKQIHTIKTPRGGTFKIVLNDGTIVHLNSDSKLSFPAVFDTNERRVSFEGEAYFDVARDSSRQFVVSSHIGFKNQEIRVYGTAFNLSAYPDDENIKTTLVEGSVKIKELLAGSEVLLKPSELAVLDENGLAMGIANLEMDLAWRNNLFYFENVPFEAVLRQIGRWYDVDIVYENEFQTNPLWGQMSRRKKLSEVLEILEKTSQLKFEIRGKEVRVMK